MASGRSYLNRVVKHLHWTHRHTQTIGSIIEGLYHVWRGLKDVRPDEVHEVSERVFTPKAKHTQSHMLNSPASSLSMHQVPEDEEERRNNIAHTLTRIPPLYYRYNACPQLWIPVVQKPAI